MANQIENNNLTIQKENLNLSELIETTIQRYFIQNLENKTILLDIEKNIYYSGDKELLPSIIINLIENAIKYSFDTIHIDVILKTINDKILLEIKDAGCGISDKDKQTVFLVFSLPLLKNF